MAISRKLWTLAALLLLRLAGPAPATAADLPYPERSGPDLVQLLLDSNTCSQAYHELWNRANPTNPVTYDAFVDDHYDPEAIVCPQENGKPPLYVVLCGFLSRSRPALEPQYEIDNPSELFSPGTSPSPPRSWDMPLIEVFTAAGKRITPFGGDNCLEPLGRMADLNGDGLVERADHANCFVRGIDNAMVLEIAVVAPKPRPLLCVLYNWGEDEWTYRFTDADDDGIFDVELGPKTLHGMKPNVRYAWDPESKTYLGPEGEEGDHFRRLATSNDLFRSLHRLKKAGLTFPPDPDFKDERSLARNPWEQRGAEKPTAETLSKPYRPGSLRNLTHEEILRYMGDGKNAAELEQASILTNRVPDAFWTSAPEDAALAFVDANRYPVHRDLYALAVDGRDGQKPPDSCSVAFTCISDKSYFDVDAHYFLRVDPKRSYLALARSEDGGIVFFNFIHNRPVYDFRLCELDYEEARHLAHALWWLDRVRSHRETPPPDGLGSGFSTADGHGGIVFRNAAGEEIFRREDTLWSDHVAERWKDDYSPDVFLNLASHIFYSAFPNRLGERWARLAPPKPPRADGFDPSACPPPESATLPEQTAAFLGMYSPDSTALSLAIAREAVRAAGQFAEASLEPRLVEILAQLPIPAPTRSRKDIEAEMEPLRAIPYDQPDGREAADRLSRLHEELMASYRDTGADDVQSLRDSIELSLRQIRKANDFDVLQAWACTREPGAAWALQRLRTVDPTRYMAALEWWLRNSTETWARQAFDAITCEDEPRAREIAREIVPDARPDLAVSSFAQLAQASDLPDGPRRIAALIRIALSTNSYWQERGRAIELLVPPDQPLKYPDPEIDEALVRLFDPALADDLTNWTLGEACQALARRGRTDSFEAMARTLMPRADLFVCHQVLQALVQLAQADPQRLAPRLLAILRAQLRHTNKSVPELLMDAWAADLRKLLPDVERIATSGPDDYESERANCYGGEASAVDDRFHLARQIAALWNEEDPATAAKLLLAFGFHQARNLSVDSRPEQAVRMDAELSRLARTLAPEQRPQAAAFLEWLRTTQIDPAHADQDPRAKFLERAASALLPPAP